MESNFFKERREELKLTQRQVSLALEITESTVRNWEAFRNQPPFSMAAALAEVYRVSVERIDKAIVQCARVMRDREAVTSK